MRARPILALLVLAVLVSPRGYAARGEVYALVGGRVMPVSGAVIEKRHGRDPRRPHRGRRRERRAAGRTRASSTSRG